MSLDDRRTRRCPIEPGARRPLGFVSRELEGVAIKPREICVRLPGGRRHSCAIGATRLEREAAR